MGFTEECAEGWNSVDGILVINLDTSIERWEKFKQENASALPMEKVERVSGVVGVNVGGYGRSPWFTERTGERARYWAGCAGCTLAHRRAIERAKEKGWRNVLIFEDDVLVDKCLGTLLDTFLPKLPQSYLFYAGYSRPTPFGRCLSRAGQHSVWKVEGVLSTFAYIVPQSMYELLLARLPIESDVWEWLSIHRAVDNFYRDEISAMPGVSAYVLHPDAVVVQEGASDVSGAAGVLNYNNFADAPHRVMSIGGLLHILAAPYRRLKRRLNSIRTHRRALRGGFPGLRKKRRPKA